MSEKRTKFKEFQPELLQISDISLFAIYFLQELFDIGFRELPD